MIRTVEVKVFAIGNGSFKKYTHRAGPHRQFVEKGVQAILSHYAEHLEEHAPNVDYSCVEVGPGRFNFVNRVQAKPQFVPFAAPTLEQIREHLASMQPL